MSEASVALLYRHILRAAKRFPSVKREGIIHEIKAEFHANKAGASPEEVQRKRALAVSSLRQLEEYAGLSRDEGPAWELFLKGPLNT